MVHSDGGGLSPAGQRASITRCGTFRWINRDTLKTRRNLPQKEPTMTASCHIFHNV